MLHQKAQPLNSASSHYFFNEKTDREAARNSTVTHPLLFLLSCLNSNHTTLQLLRTNWTRAGVCVAEAFSRKFRSKRESSLCNSWFLFNFFKGQERHNSPKFARQVAQTDISFQIHLTRLCHYVNSTNQHSSKSESARLSLTVQMWTEKRRYLFSEHNVAG